jgi:predicted aconitase
MLLDGSASKAAQIAMRIIVRMAGLLRADRLIDVTQAHIDGCIYTGKASLEFAQLLCEWGAEVRIPTTLNAISVDQRHWRIQGTDPSVAEPASDLADAYVRMGAQPTFTCAPYQLASAPTRGENIVWAESNAVVYANSVLGARTMKYPDYLDICIALTGRAPLAGCHIDANRRATLKVVVSDFDRIDDSFYPLLGYHVGSLAASEIPVVVGLEKAHPSRDDLKAFGAAFGTTSGAPMFHILGVTPEASSLSEATGHLEDVRTVDITTSDLAGSWNKLNTATENAVDLVSLGNPHFSKAEFERLALLCRGRKRHPEVAMVVTCGRTTYSDIVREGIEKGLRDFGVRFVVDACWCTVVEPIIPPHARTIITNSGKYAHYGPGLSGRKLHFACLGECVEAACTGQTSGKLPSWLLSEFSGRLPVS